MISTMWTSAPAGVSGPGSLAARPGTCTAAQPAYLRLRALPPTAVVGARVTRTAVPGAPFSGTGAFDLVPTARGSEAARSIDDLGVTFGPQHDQLNNDTTLGIPSSRRPQS